MYTKKSTTITTIKEKFMTTKLIELAKKLAPIHQSALEEYNLKINQFEDLLKTGVDVNEIDENGLTALEWAAHHGEPRIMALLMKYGADFNAHKDMALNLLLAATSKHNKQRQTVLTLLLERPINVNMKDRNGRTILHRDMDNEDLFTLALLINNGADIEAPGDYGCTALHVAVIQQSKDMVEFLIHKGANLNAVNEGGETPLDIAISQARLIQSRISETIINLLENAQQQAA